MVHDEQRVSWQRLLSTVLQRMGTLQAEHRDLEGALKTYEEALSLSRLLVSADSNYTFHVRSMSMVLRRMGHVHGERGDLAAALALYQESLRLRRDLMQRDSDRVRCLVDVLRSLGDVGGAQLAQGDLKAARTSYEEAHRVAQRLVKLDLDHPSYRHTLALVLAGQAQLAEVEGNLPESLGYLRDALAELELLVRSPSPEKDWLRNAAFCRAKIARLEAVTHKKRRRTRTPKRKAKPTP